MYIEFDNNSNSVPKSHIQISTELSVNFSNLFSMYSDDNNYLSREGLCNSNM